MSPSRLSSVTFTSSAASRGQLEKRLDGVALSLAGEGRVGWDAPSVHTGGFNAERRMAVDVHAPLGAVYVDRESYGRSPCSQTRAS